MEPMIKRSVREGFQAANRSVSGMAFLAGGWLLLFAVFLLSAAGMGLSQAFTAAEPTRRALALPAPASALNEKALAPVSEPKPSSPADASAPATDAPQPSAPAADSQAPDVPAPAATTDASAPAPTATPGASAPAPTAPAADVPADAALSPDVDVTEPPAEPDQNEALNDALRRSWFGLVLLSIVVVVGMMWLEGGRTGYMAKQIRRVPVGISEFWVAGTRSLGRLLGSWLLSMAGVGIGLLVIILVAMLGAVAGPGVSIALGVVLLIAALPALVWLMVRLGFWWIAIVVDGLGPIQAIKASFRATKGRWWKTAGLWGLLALIAIGVSLPFSLIEGIGRAVGGGVGMFLTIASALGSFALANVYWMFLTTGSLIRFYEDTKGAAGHQPSAVSS